MSSNTVLVTGGAGYIGSHACKALAQAGFAPVAYDNLVYGHPWAVKWGPLEIGDILDRSRLDEVIRRYRPAAVLHFAAYAYVGESVQDPAKYYRNNVGGTLTLLEAMKDHGIGNVVFSSTCATYGVPHKVPIAEDHPQQPINPYGMSKLMIERMLEDFRRAYGLRYAALRYFNAAGADAEGEIGEDHEPETHLIPLVLAAALGQRSCVEVYGTDYPTADGTAVRDYIHVTDLADAHVSALKQLLTSGDSIALNLGTGSGYSVRDIIATAERVTRRTVPYREAPRRAGDPPVLVADAAHGARMLDWTPRRSGIEEIIRTAWNWHLAHASAPARAEGRGA
jgi:UDP-arabinose 4-epimerase